MEIDCYCKKCGTRNNKGIEEENPFCSKCHMELFWHPTEEFLARKSLRQCPFCGSQHLYRQKDFNRNLGVGLLILGVIGSYWTWGLSLLAVSLLDWFLYRKVGWVGCCYQCKAQFRGNALVEALPFFELGLHDFYKNTVSN